MSNPKSSFASRKIIYQCWNFCFRTSPTVLLQLFNFCLLEDWFSHNLSLPSSFNLSPFPPSFSSFLWYEYFSPPSSTLFAFLSFFFKTMLLIQLSPLCFSSIFSQIIPVFWSLANLSYSAVISKGSLNTLLTDLAGISNGKGWWSNYEITILPLKIYSPEFLPLSFLL